MKPILCPTCKRRCTIQVNEREGEGEDEDLNLVGTHCLEAWAECPIHGWVSPRGDIRSWGPERPMDEPLEPDDRRQAVEGLRELMGDQARVAHQSLAEE